MGASLTRAPLYGLGCCLAAVVLGVVGWAAGGAAEVAFDVVGALLLVFGLWLVLVGGQRLLIDRASRKEGEKPSD